MNPTVARGGRSFKGAFAYYMHDKGTDTRGRIAWTHTVNMLTTDPDKAWKVMAFTAKASDRLKEAAGVKASGRKPEKPVMAYSLSWHPEQSPTPDHMRDVALRSLHALGLSEHQALLVAHNDTPHAHVHVIVNRIHPVTGKTAGDSYTHRKLSDLALDYAREHGLTYSPQREANKQKREAGQATRYTDSKIAEAWAVSTDGKGFVAALKERGFELAQGTKRLVVVDAYGKVHNPTRHLDGVNAKAFRDRLKGVDLAALRDADAVAQEHAARHEQQKAEKVKLREKAPALKPAFEKAADTAKDRAAKPAPVEKPDEGKRAAEKPAPQKRGQEPSALPKGAEKAPALGDTFTRYAPDKDAQGKGEADGKGGKSKAGSREESGTPGMTGKTQTHLERLAELQNRHLEVYHAESTRHEKLIAEQRQFLRQHYQMDRQEARIAELTEKCTNPSIWRRVFLLTLRDRRALAAEAATYEHSTWRFNEAIGTLENKRARELQELKDTQAREWAVATASSGFHEPQKRYEREDREPERLRTPERHLRPKPPTMEMGR